MQESKNQLLAVFDFDHTLVNGNTDTWITKLYSPAMQLIRRRQKQGWCWTYVMDGVFELLHSQKFTQEDFNKCFETLEFMEGMKETCEFLHEKKIQAIIISDSNTYFIEHLLRRDKLDGCFSHVFTNPAEWDRNGCLHVESYHSHACRSCPQNLCKMQVLEGFLNEHRNKADESFEHVVYVGDGFGDFCPAKSLTSKDYVFAREGYKLLNMLTNQQVKKLGLEATVVPWKSGFQIFDFFKKLCV